ncbi:MAG: acetyltransferase, partial [Prevotella sp.]|nr:acetyltransferase [Prevotella sp.]
MYLYGASGHAKVICDIIEDAGNNVLGFIDDNENI